MTIHVDWRRLARRSRALVLYREALASPVVGAVLALLDALASGEAPPDRCAELYAAALAAVAGASGCRGHDPWRAHLRGLVLDATNPFTERAAREGESVPAALLEQARRDLRTLGELHALDAESIHRAALDVAGGDLADAWLPWDRQGRDESESGGARGALARRLAAAPDWGELAGELAAYHRDHGSGPFARFRAFRWVGQGRQGRLEGVRHPDPIRLAELVAYDRERAAVIANTERFVAGLPANNVLLVGDRGTGKSSTVKALLNEYVSRGLRLVEVTKEQLGDLPLILAALRERPQRFILFIDDLSFEEHETEYKPLKAVLEGTVEPRPANVLLYATSNRRHLVRERFSDRQEVDDGEVRRRDTVEEKLSLADRFGLHALFLAPDQARYVRIALALARARGIGLPDDEIRQRAIRWADWHNGRSGRTARQFVDDLVGELGLPANAPS